MTLRHMKIFVAVYQNSSITKAAEQLHIVQPSVSLAIKELENYYGICLFDRIGRRIFPTASGANFYDYAIHIVSLFDEMEHKIRDWDALGSVRVGASVTIGNLLLPQIVREFGRLHPDIRITVTISNAETIEQNVMDNLVDFALTEGEASVPQIWQEPILRDRFCVIAHPSHPLSAMKEVALEDLLPYPLLLREPGSANRAMVDGLFLSKNRAVKPAWESTSTQALVRGVMNNLGVSILPYCLVRQEITQGLVAELPVKLELFRYFSIICHRNKYLSKSARAFLDLCRNYELYLG